MLNNFCSEHYEIYFCNKDKEKDILKEYISCFYTSYLGPNRIDTYSELHLWLRALALDFWLHASSSTSTILLPMNFNYARTETREFSEPFGLLYA